MSIFTNEGKLVLSDSEAEIDSVICTIKNRDSDHFFSHFSQKWLFLGRDKERHITIVNNKDIGKVNSPLDNLNINQRKESEVVVQPKMAHPNLVYIYCQIGRISKISRDMKKSGERAA